MATQELLKSKKYANVKAGLAAVRQQSEESRDYKRDISSLVFEVLLS
jgi:hypothetical protein